jgi:hypothetical protein
MDEIEIRMGSELEKEQQPQALDNQAHDEVDLLNSRAWELAYIDAKQSQELAERALHL